MTTLVFVALARSAPAGGYSASFPDLLVSASRAPTSPPWSSLPARRC